MYLDNWYTNPEVVDMLNDLQTDCIATVRWTEKGVPDVKKIQTQGKGKLSKRKEILLKLNN